jgi:hypothetical protein
MMTAQIQDRLMFRGHEFFLVGVEGDTLWTPDCFDMIPVSLSDSCERGYWMRYGMVEKQLFLTDLTIRAQDNRYRPVNGVRPSFNPMLGAAEYIHLGIEMGFTGLLLLGKDVIEPMYMRFGFQKAASYTTVLEMRFRDGRLKEVTDFSAYWDDVRAEAERRITEETAMGIVPDQDDIARWLDSMRQAPGSPSH